MEKLRKDRKVQNRKKWEKNWKDRKKEKCKN